MSAQRHRWNRRKAMAALLAVSVLLLAAIAIAGQVLREQALATDFTRKKSAAQPVLSLWDRLDGAGHVCPQPYRVIHQHTHRAFDGMHQRGGGFHSGNHGSLSGQDRGCCHRRNH